MDVTSDTKSESAWKASSNIVFLKMLVAGVILKMATMSLLKMASAACAIASMLSGCLGSLGPV